MGVIMVLIIVVSCLIEGRYAMLSYATYMRRMLKESVWKKRSLLFLTETVYWNFTEISVTTLSLSVAKQIVFSRLGEPRSLLSPHMRILW